MACSVESDTKGNKGVHHRSLSFLRLAGTCFGLFEADSGSEVRTPQLSSRMNNGACRGEPGRSGSSIVPETIWIFPGWVLLSERVVPGLWNRRKRQRWERNKHFQMQTELWELQNQSLSSVWRPAGCFHVEARAHIGFLTEDSGSLRAAFTSACWFGEAELFK